ncbi:unnamed protein product, partial [Medioppia subpectinata]
MPAAMFMAISLASVVIQGMCHLVSICLPRHTAFAAIIIAVFCIVTSDIFIRISRLSHTVQHMLNILPFKPVFNYLMVYLYGRGRCLTAVIVIYILYTLFIENDDQDRLKPIFEDVDRPYNRNVIDGQYPKGWYIVCASDEVPMGGVKPFSICGQEYLVFRGYSGVPSVLTAYCPHLGANIG